MHAVLEPSLTQHTRPIKMGIREMDQWLKALAALVDDIGLVPSTHIVAGNNM